MWERRERRDAKVPPTLFFGSQQRKQNHVTNGFSAGEQHCEPVDTDTKTTCRRHTVLKRKQEFLVDVLLLFSRLFDQTLTLYNWIIQLTVTWGDLHTINHQFKNVHERAVFRILFG